jgi:ATP-dependent Lon protease
MRAVGQTNGLVWSPDGANLIQIKTLARKGRGKLLVEGDIGHDFLVALETAVYLLQFNVDIDIEKYNLTIKVPFPIDGPSAALPLFISMYSALTKNAVNQSMALTGALSETGAVLAVGSIIDKLRAVSRANLEAIIFPLENMVELPKHADTAPWGNVVLSPIMRVQEAIVLAC